MGLAEEVRELGVTIEVQGGEEGHATRHNLPVSCDPDYECVRHVK